MAYTFQVTIDCSDPHVLADWWAATLGWDVPTQDAAFIRRMIDEGQATEGDTTTHRGALVWREGAAIVHPEGTDRAPRIYFQMVPEIKSSKNRVHLDVRIGEDDLEAVVERATSSGATFLYGGNQGPHRWMTLSDPEGKVSIGVPKSGRLTNGLGSSQLKVGDHVGPSTPGSHCIC